MGLIRRMPSRLVRKKLDFLGKRIRSHCESKFEILNLVKIEFAKLCS